MEAKWADVSSLNIAKNTLGEGKKERERETGNWSSRWNEPTKPNGWSPLRYSIMYVGIVASVRLIKKPHKNIFKVITFLTHWWSTSFDKSFFLVTENLIENKGFFYKAIVLIKIGKIDEGKVSLELIKSKPNAFGKNESLELMKLIK